MQKSPTILIVDDEDSIRRLVHTMLHGCGYHELLEAADAESALEIAEQHDKPIDLLLSDIILGGDVNGVTLAHEIADALPEIKVVLMSGYEGGEGLDLERGWQFIRKPFQPSALIHTVEAALTRPPALVD